MLYDLRQVQYPEDMPVKVSICVVSFNHQNYIRQCLESLLDQECGFRVEIIVHDDASTDETANVIKKFQETYPTVIRGILQTENQYSKGVNAQYNYVFPKARGEYIAVCDGDDFWCDPNKLALQVAVLDQNDDVAVTYGRVKAVSEGGITEPFKNGSERDLSSKDLKRGMPINTVTACFRNVFQVPPEYLKYAPMGDMTVWSVLGSLGRGKYMPEIMSSGYRLHTGGIFSSKSLQTKRFMGAMTLISMAAYHAEKGDREAMRACIKRLFGILFELNGVRPSLTEALRKSFSLGLKKLNRK